MANKQTLDARIANCLASNGSADRDTLGALINEAGAAITAAEEVFRINSALALDITNPDPDEADNEARTAERSIKRLTAAIPRLQERVDAIDAAARHAKWNADYDKLEIETAALAAEFRERYPELCIKMVDLFVRLNNNRDAIVDLGKRQYSRRAGDPFDGAEHRPELREAELIARGLPMFTTHQPRIADNLKLPFFKEPTKVYPRSEYDEIMYQTALLNSAMNAQLEARRALAPPNTEEQRRLEYERFEAERLKKDAESREALYRSQVAEDRRRRGVE